MKFCLPILLLITTYVLNAQTRPVNHKNEPVYVLDSVKYARMPLFDTEKLESVSVVKDKPAEFPHGVLIMKSKDGTDFNFISLEDLAKKQIGDTKSYMMMIDNDFITNMTGFVIDSAYVLKCYIVSTKDFAHLQQMPEMKILKVTTASKANVERAKKIILRGKS